MSAGREKGGVLLAIRGCDSEDWLAALRQAAPDRPVTTDPGDANRDAIRYAVVWKPPPGLLAGLPRLEAIFSVGAGVDHLLCDPDLPDLPVVRVVSGDLTLRMREFVVWQVLDHARQGQAYRALQAAAEWRELPQPAAGDLTVGIMGLGVLGTDAALHLAALGFRVAGWSRTEKAVGGVACHSGAAGLDAFLAETDILVVLLPLTVATRGMLNADLFARLKRQTPLGGPVLINAGRGGLQVEADIVAALESGALMAASLDVFETEPLPPTSPLWRHPRVTVTPHAAAASDPRALVPPMVRQMEAHEAGQALRDLVDRGAGY